MKDEHDITTTTTTTARENREHYTGNEIFNLTELGDLTTYFIYILLKQYQRITETDVSPRLKEKKKTISSFFFCPP